MSKNIIESAFRDNYIALIMFDIISIGSIVIYIKMAKIFFGYEERSKKRYILEKTSLALVIAAIFATRIGFLWQVNSFAINRLRTLSAGFFIYSFLHMQYIISL